MTSADRRRSQHYFTAAPTAASRPGTVRFEARGLSVEAATDRATFSPGRLDPGTAFLLDAAPEPPAAGRFLDLGCGWGPIAVVLALLRPEAEIVAVDVNERSRALCAENARRAGVDNVRVVDPSGVDGTFDRIWSNPPIRIGKTALHEILRSHLARLDAPDGRAVLVVGRHLGADSLQRWLGEHGHDTVRLGSKRGYRLLESGPVAGP